jgi:hypothetical protein
MTTKHPVERACSTNREALDAAGQRRRRVGLDEQMHVIALHGEVQDPERRCRARRDRTAKRGGRHIATERREPVLRSQRHVRRTMRAMRRATSVRDARPLARRRLASGTDPASAPRRERQIHLPATAHL